MSNVFLRPMAVNTIVGLPIVNGQFILDKGTGYLYIDWANIRHPAGFKGEPGEQGVKGDKGDIGGVGPAGVAGPAGPVGIQGPVGAMGNDGQNGKDAVTFYPSIDGATGVLKWSNDGGAANPPDMVVRGENGRGVKNVVHVATEVGRETFKFVFSDDTFSSNFYIPIGLPTLSVLSTTTGAAGTNANVSASGMGTAESPFGFSFTLPRGDKGDTGERGEKGEKGDKLNFVYDSATKTLTIE